MIPDDIDQIDEYAMNAQRPAVERYDSTASRRALILMTIAGACVVMIAMMIILLSMI